MLVHSVLYQQWLPMSDRNRAVASRHVRSMRTPRIVQRLRQRRTRRREYSRRIEAVMNCQEVLRYTEPNVAHDWTRMTLYRATDASDTLDMASLLSAAYCQQHTDVSLDTLASYLQTRHSRGLPVPGRIRRGPEGAYRERVTPQYGRR
ncbi:hypothetical protein ACIOKD_35320 [Streptomyces sp. NPDC087844]|uniref:hypothetical protein n=1 Tax=Streptomyces sp. NPDC087844 TaxID=3365805 RepID=UPI0038020B48